MENTNIIPVRTRVKVFFEKDFDWRSGMVISVSDDGWKYQVYFDDQTIINNIEADDILEEHFSEYLFDRKGFFGKWSSATGIIVGVVFLIATLISMFAKMPSIWINVGLVFFYIVVASIIIYYHYRNFKGTYV